MRYFKLIKNNTIFGIINNDNFRKYQKKHQLILYSDISSAEFIDFQNDFYYATWLNPYPSELQSWNIENIIIEEIEQEEYNILKESLKTQEIIIQQQKEKEILPQVEDNNELNNPSQQNNLNQIENLTLEYVRKIKIAEIQKANQNKLKEGLDVFIDNEIKHITIDSEGLLNLMTLLAEGSQEKNSSILIQINTFKQKCNSYKNSLIQQINTINNIKDINEIKYNNDII